MATLEGAYWEENEWRSDPVCRTHPTGCPEPGTPALYPQTALRVESLSFNPYATSAPSPHERMRDEIRARRRARGR